MFIGRTAFCRNYFARLAGETPEPGYESSDQAIVVRIWPEWYPEVQDDYFSQIFQWFNEDLSVMRLERPAAPRHTQLFRWLRRLRGPVTGAEVGVFGGHTSEALLREFPRLMCHTINTSHAYSIHNISCQLLP